MHFPLRTLILRSKHCDPLYLLRTLGLKCEYCALLESADRQGSNDFSFLALGARDIVTVQSGAVSGSRYIADGPIVDALSVFERFADAGGLGYPRLSMGYIGFLSFEEARHFEAVDLMPGPKVPDAVFVLPEILLKIDHARREVTMIFHIDTTEDIQKIQDVIHASPFHEDTKIGAGLLVPDRTLPTSQEIDSYRQTSRKDYCDAVAAIQQDILAGEVFQVVLSQELCLQTDVRPDDVYKQLRRINPSPYMYYFQMPKRTIVGASPETLIRVEGDRMLYRPIAGTRKRTGSEAEDRALREELLQDQKERAEHQMLVDLGRNDIGRVAEIGSVQVRDAFRVEQYAHVFHLVSDITGRLRPGLTSLDALRSVFPAGTLTGAPKMRAMETIQRLESAPRGIYGGAFGYIDQSGNLDFAITIRTMLFQDGCISLRVGAGIVRDSVPEKEDDECLQKARSCLAALELARSTQPVL